jgi:glycosyltransferase involved in cell wall biosynthesis
MTRILQACLVTLGDPATLTGGYLFHRRLAERAAGNGARLEFVSFGERPYPWPILDGPRVLARLRRLRPDVLVLDSIAAAFLAPWLTFQKPPAPMVGMLHQPPGGIDHGPLRARSQAALDRIAYRRAARLLLASESLLPHFTEFGDRVFVVPPGRDVAAALGEMPANPRRGRAAALLCVGNWVERKGILDVLDAVARLEPRQATLHLVGDTRTDPPYAERVWRRLQDVDLRERVEVHGPLPLEDVAAWYAAADAFVLPSYREPYGTVYGEAMAYGLPVVGWRAGNLPYLAEHEREGLLVAPGDRAGLAAALDRLCSDQSLRERLGSAALERASHRPTWQDVARMFFDHLRAVIQ